MMINGDGSAVWFDASRTPNKPCLYRYDLASRKVDRHEVVWPSETDWQDHQMSDLHWILDDDLPANFWHDIRHDEGREPGRFRVPDRAAPASPPSDADDPWPFVTTLSSVRQSLMDEISNGSNALIWPVRWRPSGSYWTEDSQAAELDARTGRTLRTIALPQRFGTPDSFSAAGVAQWCPSRLVRRRVNGSRQASCSCSTTTAACRPMKYPGPKRARFVGMHVVDLKSGHVLSALLGSANNLKAAARSANGRLRWARPQAAGSIASHSGTSHRAAHPRSSTHRRYPETARSRRWPFRGAVRRCGHSARAN